MNYNNETNQSHVHEVQGSVEIAGPQGKPHNHRFTAMTGEAIPLENGDHVHDVYIKTDYYFNHFHEFYGRTGGAIKIGDRHVHALKSSTTTNFGHSHDFRLVSFVEDPSGV